MVLGQDADKTLIAKGVRPGSPSSKVDLQPGDTICSIDGSDAGLDSMDEAARLMRGAPGTTVVLDLHAVPRSGIAWRSSTRVL